MLLADYTARLGIAPDKAEMLVLDALQVLANREILGPRRAHFQKPYTIPITTTVIGGISFTAASLDDSTDILIDHIGPVRHMTTDGVTTTTVSMLPKGATSNDLLRERNTMFYHGVVEANEILMKQGDGTNVPDGTAEFKAGFAPTLDNLKPRFDDDLLAVSREMIADV